MDDKEMKELLRPLEDAQLPPKGLKEKMLSDIILNSQALQNIDTVESELGHMQRMFFERPLRAAAVLSVCVSSIFWAVFRDGYVNLLSGFMRVR